MLKQQKTGSIICPSCGKLISANAERCIHCGRKNPGLWGYSEIIRKIFGTDLGFIPIATAFCVVMYVISLLLDPSAIFKSRSLFDILSPSGQSLLLLGATGSYPLSHGRWWTILTAIYLHGSLIHILFNMLWFRQLGSYVQDLFGNARLVIIFTVSGVAGFIVSNSFGIQFTIGASGSIFGLLGALIFYGRKRGGEFGMSVLRQVGSWAIVLFLFGFLWSGINNWAHFGGFVGGYLSAMVIGFHETNRENQVHQMLAIGCVVITLVAFGLSILGGL